jgi:hypothetical protein
LRKHLLDVFANVPNDRTPVHVYFFIVAVTWDGASPPCIIILPL